MLSKARLKWIRQLHQKKFRSELKLFIAEGEKVVEELINSNLTLESIYATSEWVATGAIAAEVIRITQEELNAISVLEAPNKVFAIGVQPQYELPELIKNSNYLVIDGIRDPGNLGTLIRIADWFNFQSVFCSSDSVELYNPKVVQSAMGSLFRKKVIACDLSELLQKNSLPVYAATLDGNSIYDTSFEPGMLVIGNESRGISPGLFPYVNHKITIPSFGTDNRTDSLNAAVACAVISSQIKQYQIKNPAFTG